GNAGPGARTAGLRRAARAGLPVLCCGGRRGAGAGVHGPGPRAGGLMARGVGTPALFAPYPSPPPRTRGALHASRGGTRTAAVTVSLPARGAGSGVGSAPPPPTATLPCRVTRARPAYATAGPRPGPARRPRRSVP